MKYLAIFPALIWFFSFNIFAVEKYEPKKLWGEAEKDKQGNLIYVVENSSQTHERKNCVMLKVSGFKIRAGAKEIGRIRVASWDSAENYAKEGVKPFRASSYWARDSNNGEMKFKLCGYELGKSYSFFAHFDQDNTGFIRKFLGIPREPYMFSNAKNNGTGDGIKRKGLSAPDFAATAIVVAKDGQEIILKF